MSKRSYSTTGFAVPPSSSGLAPCNLVVVAGPGVGNVHPIDEPEITVGCSMGCHIFVNDSSVSREHFAITMTAAGMLIRDLDSTNGTFVNEVRIKEAYLQPGQVVRAGSLSLRVDPR